MDLSWVVLVVVVVVALGVDLGLLGRGTAEPTTRQAAGWSAAWVSLGAAFAAWVWLSRGAQAGTEFVTAYLLELSLSVDNLFVISVIFSSMAIPRRLQRRVLFWGILGAVVSRGLAVGLGVELLHRFEWMTYVFGAFLIYTAWKLFDPGESEDVETEGPVLRLARKVLPFTERIEGEAFFLRVDRRWHATPLFLALIVVETTDVVFAVDSIPAVLGVSHDPFVVYSSNVFAVLGLRAMYFLLADAVVRFHYMKYALSGLLGFVGAKMLAESVVHLPVEVSLAVIAGVLVVAGVASAVRERFLQTERADWKASHSGHTVQGAPTRSAVPPSGKWGPAEKVALLHRLPAFRGSALDDLREIADDLYVLEYAAGDLVFSQGDEADALYVVIEGEVAVVHGYEGMEAAVGSIGPGESFGEVALFAGTPRTATVRAVTDTATLALARDAFQRLGARRPAVLLEVIRVLSRRLRDANERLVSQGESLATPEPAPSISTSDGPPV